MAANETNRVVDLATMDRVGANRALVEEHGGWQSVGVFGADVKVGTMYLPAIETTWYALSVRDSDTEEGGTLVWLSYAERERLIVALGGTV